MKKIIIFLLVLSGISTQAFADPYKSIFGDSTTKWVYVWGDEFGLHNDTIFIVKDTTVNGTLYKKAVNSHYQSEPIFLLREDTTTGTVWCRSVYWLGHPDDTTDRIIARMDLSIGDTFDVSNIRLEAHNNTPSNNIVDSIRQVNGLKHIYMRGQYYGEPYALIEGVGSNMGIFWKYKIIPENTFTGGFYLLCSYKDGVKTNYENRAYKGACWIATNINSREIKNNNTVYIYPQPAKDIVYLRNESGTSIRKVIIVSLAGQIILEVTEPDIKSIKLVNIPSGFYRLKVFSTDGQISNKPLVVQ